MIFLIHKTFLICKSYYLMKIFYEKIYGKLWKYSKREYDSRTRIFLLPAPIQGNDLPGQVRRGVNDGVCKPCGFFWGTEPAGWDFLTELHTFLRGKTLVHLGIDYAAGNGIYRNAAGGKFFCQSFGKGVGTSFGSRVGHFAGCPNAAPDRGNIQDCAGFFADHGRDCVFAAAEHGSEVCVQDAVPFF